MVIVRGFAARLTMACGVVWAGGASLPADDTLVPTASEERAEAPASEEGPSTVKTDVVRERYLSQAVKIERSITQDANLNFVNHGPWTMWDPAGNMIAKGEYRYGKRHGAWKRWFIGNAGVKSGDPGQKDETADAFTGPEYSGFTRPFTSDARFIDDKLVGTWTVVDAEGKSVFSVEFDHDVLSGKAVSWFPGGGKQREITLRNGVVDGEWKEWDQNRNLIKNDHYIDGSRLAEAVLTFDSGEKSAEGVYLYAKDVVKADLDWWTGKLNIQIAPAEGKQVKQGKWTYWYQTGEKRCDAEFFDDKPVGAHTWYYRNGQKECEGRHLDGLAHGTWTYWHDNGLQAAQGEYVKGNRVGRWIRWNAEGKVVENIDHGTGTGNIAGRQFMIPAYTKTIVSPTPVNATPATMPNPNANRQRTARLLPQPNVRQQ